MARNECLIGLTKIYFIKLIYHNLLYDGSIASPALHEYPFQNVMFIVLSDMISTVDGSQNVAKGKVASRYHYKLVAMMI